MISMTRKSDNKTFATKVMKKPCPSPTTEVFPRPRRRRSRERSRRRKLGGKKQFKAGSGHRAPSRPPALTTVRLQITKHPSGATSSSSSTVWFFARPCGAVAHCHANQISHRASWPPRHRRDVVPVTASIDNSRDNTGDTPENLLVTFERGR